MVAGDTTQLAEQQRPAAGRVRRLAGVEALEAGDDGVRRGRFGGEGRRRQEGKQDR
jgi:hypothetical protein